MSVHWRNVFPEIKCITLLYISSILFSKGYTKGGRKKKLDLLALTPPPPSAQLGDPKLFSSFFNEYFIRTCTQTSGYNKDIFFNRKGFSGHAEYFLIFFLKKKSTFFSGRGFDALSNRKPDIAVVEPCCLGYPGGALLPRHRPPRGGSQAIKVRDSVIWRKNMRGPSLIWSPPRPSLLKTANKTRHFFQFTQCCEIFRVRIYNQRNKDAFFGNKLPSILLFK